MEFSLWKQVRKRLRRRRRSLWILGSFVLLLTAANATVWTHEVYAASPDAIETLEKLEEQKEPLVVWLRHVYVCGEETRPLGLLNAARIKQMLAGQPELKPVMGQDGRSLTLEKRIEDLSEECRANAYFGMDRDGNLSLFEGEPKEEKVMRTFFQLDVKYMESSLSQDKVDQLTAGIKVNDIDEYNSVLSTFSDFALQENERAMKPAY
ncbi:BofC C-terminal domain-containing protein [Paenibacillus sp. NPDC058071]|uniref:BofC C-terminal domain-containing protein n=1 Tax=Paenibacillus sp. NPDC058071 TaxID=3346326 RepID=UPI0036D9B13D